ncbi:MAG TPA: DUF2147 domain-containing protein [Verrucomicrobiae bacterium]|nr:DUF2147 domain-containing protein [Verrucomicrobiae bacterium]
MSSRGEEVFALAPETEKRHIRGVRCGIVGVLLALVVWLQLPVLAAEPGDEVLGVWHTTDDKGQVLVFKDNKHYCAKIISIKDPNWPASDEEGMGGKPKNDRRNPDPKLRSRSIAGIRFMNYFVYEGNNLWQHGTIYDPESGNTYRCRMSMIATNQLRVRGYVGIPLFGRTVVWTREPAH